MTHTRDHIIIKARTPIEVAGKKMEAWHAGGILAIVGMLLGAFLAALL